ncbi:uncharacterized protein [Primulina huaijiensis]|uniref:uncharacterized protein isoform X2 n=1 Tax=Primulina huaijiensis TaxID=1492673 RepID=UPI003CC72726
MQKKENGGNKTNQILSSSSIISHAATLSRPFHCFIVFFLQETQSESNDSNEFNSLTSFIFTRMEKLVELSDSEIRIDFVLDCKCRTYVQIKSLISAATLAFKVQTSSPHKFLVNPPSGLVAPLSCATFQIVLKPQSHLPPTFPRSPADRFLLKTAVAPDLNIDSPESTQSEVVNRWFNSGPHRPTYDVKLKVYFVGPFLLTHAVGAGDIEAVKGIIKRQRSVVSEFSNLEADSLYRVANQLGDHTLIDLLLEAGLKVDARKGLDDDVKCASSKGWSELHVAAAFDRTEELERLAKGRTAVDCRDKEGRTPLHLAASKGQLSSAKVLVTAGANLDSRSKDGRTALYRAAENGDRRMVEMLFEAGADPTIGDVDNFRSPIDIARDKGHFLSFGFNIEYQDRGYKLERYPHQLSNMGFLWKPHQVSIWGPLSGLFLCAFLFA